MCVLSYEQRNALCGRANNRTRASSESAQVSAHYACARAHLARMHNRAGELRRPLASFEMTTLAAPPVARGANVTNVGQPFAFASQRMTINNAPDARSHRQAARAHERPPLLLAPLCSSNGSRPRPRRTHARKCVTCLRASFALSFQATQSRAHSHILCAISDTRHCAQIHNPIASNTHTHTHTH